MQALVQVQGLTSLQGAVLRSSAAKQNIMPRVASSSSSAEEKGLQNMTVADVLMTKREEKVSSWFWCRTTDSAHEAAKNMAKNNIGSLVVLKPGDQQYIAGIITERVIAQGRSSKYTKVGEIMTDENKLITVAEDTNILKAMQLMTDHHIRHAPVIDGNIVGMISIVDVFEQS
ncbi:unnamed protein product [Linum trigynum]|uniref:CBS domain-containing protein n=1 Tax=Linum trigynum TaxID=586398 RepID=A0AAV2CJC9_9ROSI